ncbi:HPr kinase/phosphorylase [Sphingomonas mollis]|uniref:HPr kinase/phosphatase C-terminal domain-containing protein n=1 Tax=Sphingomonas mollis TaxID=2795726 RepID=A0ABS0XLZ6_9SPHN|nr:HPr kinase/phosphatase C-terminal domain-containing protein [Sphingomonas sp. BT553]MBJ6121045.1 HPr kinase/phosphatase C-terminal domain-containing protein [Sphingomonas sp. BT553]
MSEPDTETLHASTVAIDGRAVLIEGPSGAGKSDLALRLIDRGAILVSDDYTVVKALDEGLIASPPPTIAGRIEVRGLGILDLPVMAAAPVALFITLVDEPERMPEPASRLIAGRPVRMLALDPFTASAPIKVELAMRREMPA